MESIHPTLVSQGPDIPASTLVNTTLPSLVMTPEEETTFKETDVRQLKSGH